MRPESCRSPGRPQTGEQKEVGTSDSLALDHERSVRTMLRPLGRQNLTGDKLLRMVTMV